MLLSSTYFIVRNNTLFGITKNMISNSLILNESESFNSNTNSNRKSLNTKNTVLGDSALIGSIQMLEAKGGKSSEFFTFNEYMEVVADVKELKSKDVNINILPQDGNQFPLIGMGVAIDTKNELDESVVCIQPFDLQKNENIQIFRMKDTLLVISDINEKFTTNNVAIINDKETSISVNKYLKEDLSVMEKLINLDVSKITQKLPLVNKINVELKDGVQRQVLTKNIISNEKLINLDVSKTTQESPLVDKINIEFMDKEQMEVLTRNIISDEEGMLFKDQGINKKERLVVPPQASVNLLKIAEISKLDLERVSRVNQFSVDGVKIDISDSSQLTYFNTNIKPVTDQNLTYEPTLFKQPLNTNGQFSNGLGVRIQWMLQQALSSAEIMLDPPELGPLNVKIVQAGNEANIIFQAHTPQGKEAIEDNLTKLKEMLLSQGISLGETEVQQKQNESQTDEKTKNKAAQTQIDDSENNDGNVISDSLKNHTHTSLLDTYI